MILYTLTTIVPGYPSEESKKYGGKRTPAIFTTLEKAQEIIDGNLGDIFETTYRYAVIEQIEADILYGGFDYKQWWYEWQGDYETGKYVPRDPPEEYKRIINIGIG